MVRWSMNKINCKHLRIANGGENSVTHWFECVLHNKATDPGKCGGCQDRVPWKELNGNDNNN